MKTANLSIETAREMYAQGGAAKLFALDNYSEQELTKKALPKTWEELESIKGYFVYPNSSVTTFNGSVITHNKNVFATEAQAKASIALAQLSQLREVYRGGWVPDWKDKESLKYNIELFENRMDLECRRHAMYFLSFPTAEIRDEFLANFRDLIEQAKPLMS